MLTRRSTWLRTSRPLAAHLSAAAAALAWMPALASAASVGGSVWLDLDGDGFRDVGEPGLGGVVIYSDLDANGRLGIGEYVGRSRFDDPATPSDETGRWWIDDLPAETFTLQAEPIPETAQSFPRGGGYLVALSPSETVSGLDFGLQSSVTSLAAVDTPLDAVDVVPGDGVCATAGGGCSLRAAIQEANATPGPGVIFVAAGDYDLSIAGADEDEALTGDLDIVDDLVIVGSGADVTVVDALGLDRVFEIPVAGLDRTVELRDLTIRGGSAATATGPTGGGVESYGQLRVLRSEITANQANLAGGIMNRRSLELVDSLVHANEALPLGFTNSSAGGVASPSTSAGGIDVTLLMERSAIVDNRAPSIGGLEIGNADFARIDNSTLSGNDGDQLNVFNADVVVQHSTIVSASGRGISAGSFSGSNLLEIVNSVFEGTPACQNSTSLPIQVMLTGTNASSDTSCGFSGPADVEGIDLVLSPLWTVASTRLHHPGQDSPLLDAAADLFCLPDDQRGSARPEEGDGVGIAECDLGSVEVVPEPSAGLGSTLGALAAAGFLRRRRGVSRRKPNDDCAVGSQNRSGPKSLSFSDPGSGRSTSDGSPLRSENSVSY